MAIYELKVYENDFRDYLDGHDWLDRMNDSDFERAAEFIVERATSQPDGRLCNDFQEWFLASTYFDEVWDNVAQAMDEYIDTLEVETLKALED